MQAFVEERLDVGYDYGVVGGPGFSTDVVVFGSGHEHRNANWDNARRRWELGERNINLAKKDYLQAFFAVRRGMAVGFRFKDWLDWQAKGETLSPDGTPTVQLVKTYASAGESNARDIIKPVSGTVSLTHNGSDYTPAAIDTTTGIVTLAAEWSAAIENITQADPAVVTITGHGRSSGEVLYIDGVSGMTEINGQAYSITVIDADTFSLDGVDSTGFGAYTSDGTAYRYVQPSDTLTWSGEFDVPARFDTDEFRARFEAYRKSPEEAIYFLASLPVVEIRL